MSSNPPESLQLQWRQHWEHFQQQVSEQEQCWLQQQLDADSLLASDIQKVWSCSDFVANSCAANPLLFRELVEKGFLYNRYSDDEITSGLAVLMVDVVSKDDLMRVLRQFRAQQMIRIVWRDFTRQASLVETTTDMSRLAEAVLQAALDFLYAQACKDWGVPIGKSGAPQQMVVLGMGKLGACELNVSSDIDLIFAYPESGETVHKNDSAANNTQKSLSNQEFFIRLSQQLIKVLDVRNADGFVFRVDMRLRPYGQSGALIVNFNAMDEYYQSQGRGWERYAMIKARVVAGDQEAGKQLMSSLRLFTYRKYTDFTAIQSLRDMKALINQEVQRKGMAENIKRGAGGIREVEFIAQAFQIIRGGRDTRFQTPSLAAVYKLLDEQHLLPEGRSDELMAAYTFLRDVEHRLQGWQDQQTQTLPSDEQGQTRLAYLMGFVDWDAFSKELDVHRQLIRSEFDNMVAEKKPEVVDVDVLEHQQRAEGIWESLDAEQAASTALAQLGYAAPQEALTLLKQLADSRPVKNMHGDTRSRLDTLMPLLIGSCASVENPAETLQRTLLMVEAVLRRSAYLLLLIESPAALTSLVKLCSGSLWIAQQITLYPALLDELLDHRTLYSLPSRAELEDELRQQMLRIPEDDLETLMETLRYFRRSHSLRVAACEVEGSLPLMRASDYLSWLAEAILSHVYALVWEQMAARYGRPRTASGDEAGLVVVGYGKLGGHELGHGSDLDLVFLHDANPSGYTDGERSIDNATFFTRLGQRMIHILNTQTASGYLYEVDTRLRPSGNSGMLVTTLQSFKRYQQEGAWTWEHQALVRARAIAGNEKRVDEFNSIRRDVLCRPRDATKLKADIVQMREKMRGHLGTKPRLAGGKKTNKFHLKQDAGGIVDIEFIVQYYALRYASQFPDLVEYTDNVRILEAIKRNNLLPNKAAQHLRDAYIFYRSLGHRLNLQGASHTVERDAVSEHRDEITDIWQTVFEA